MGYQDVGKYGPTLTVILSVQQRSGQERDHSTTGIAVKVGVVVHLQNRLKYN
jgi:hypothetical protein